MQLLLNQIFTGVVSGAVLVLLALGLNLIFGFMEIVNFSHGAFFMVGAYIAFYLASVLGSFWWGLTNIDAVEVFWAGHDGLSDEHGF